MRLTFVIPVYISNELHLDFTRQTLDSIKTTHDYEVLVVVNHCAPEFDEDLRSLLTAHCSLLTNPKGNILASAWNLGITRAFDAHRPPSTTHNSPQVPQTLTHPNPKRTPTPSDNCLIINNDIIFHPQCIDNLVTFAHKNPQFLLWSASEWSNARTLSSAKLTQSFSLHPHFSCFMVSSKTIDTVGLFDEHFTFGYFEDNDYHTRILQKGFQAAATDSAKFYHYGSRTINVDDDLKVEGKYHYQKNREYFKQKWGLDIHGKAFSPPSEILKHIKPTKT